MGVCRKEMPRVSTPRRYPTTHTLEVNLLIARVSPTIGCTVHQPTVLSDKPSKGTAGRNASVVF